MNLYFDEKYLKNKSYIQNKQMIIYYHKHIPFFNLCSNRPRMQILACITFSVKVQMVGLQNFLYLSRISIKIRTNSIYTDAVIDNRIHHLTYVDGPQLSICYFYTCVPKTKEKKENIFWIQNLKDIHRTSSSPCDLCYQNPYNYTYTVFYSHFMTASQNL